MTTPSSWLVGSLTLDTDATIVVGGVNNAVIAAGTYYLYDAAPALSLLDVILAAVAPFMTDEVIVVLESRKIRVTASVAFAWSIPAALQGALGFGASIGSTTSATAADVSELLWSPGWCATTTGHPTGTTGWETSQRVVTSSPSGLTIRTTRRGTAMRQTALDWQFVLRSRAWAAGQDDGSPGDFRRWWREVVDPGQRWKLYEGTEEDDASTTAVTWGTPFGPYKTADERPAWWDRSIPNADTHSGVRFAGVVTAEIS